VLKLGAIELDDRARISEQDLRGRLDDAGLPGAGGSQEQHVPDRTTGGAHLRTENLVEIDDGTNALLLPDDLAAERRLEFLRFDAASRGIQMMALG
jgi:hypothetical protein